MARIRTIKPEFWTDPDIVCMPMAARLFFIGCWNHADDYGVLKDDPERLRLQIMPADPIDAPAIVDELVERRHLVRMVSPDGTRVLVVRTFDVHQKIDRRAAGRWGEPKDFVPAQSPQVATTADDPLPDPHQSPPIPTTPAEAPPIPTDPALGREGKGMEGKGENTPPKSGSSTDLALVPDPSPPTATVSDRWEAFWNAYPRKTGKVEARKAWDRARKRSSIDRIDEGLAAHLPPWRTFEEQFIPHPATWLNGGRYDDEPPKPRTAQLDKPASNRAKIAASLARMEAGS